MDKAGLVAEALEQGKKNYKARGKFYALFLVPQIKSCLTKIKYGVISEHKTFKRFTNVSANLDRENYFRLLHGSKLKEKFPLSWNKTFDRGVVIPHKLGNRSKCTKDILCQNCEKVVNRRK